MGKRKVDRPKTTWRRTVDKERTMAGWKSWEEARAMAKDRDKWRKSSAALCATEREEDRWGEVKCNNKEYTVLEGSAGRKRISNENEAKQFKNGKQLTLKTATNSRR